MERLQDKETLILAIKEYEALSVGQKKLLELLINYSVDWQVTTNITTLSELTKISRTGLYKIIVSLEEKQLINSTKTKTTWTFKINYQNLAKILEQVSHKQKMYQKSDNQ